MEYIKKNIIGEGASGAVYKGIDKDNKNVSIKFLPKNEKSKTEINILSSLNHENILRFIDFYETPKNICLVTELCEYNLINFINEYNVDINISKKIIRMILCGLEYLHSKNIIHRDIKLANILIQDNSVKICDFGLSCFENKNKFSICGTEDYVAPEIINKLSYTKSVDIYSAGKVFITLLRIKNDIDFGCNDLLSKMLEKNPINRISAYDALRHPIFSDFLPKVCDFRFLKNFKVSEKFGFIEKNDNTVYFDDIKLEIYDLKSRNLTKTNLLNIINFKEDNTFNGSKLFNIKFEDCFDYEFIFYLNNIKTEIFLFTNSQLKTIIYGMAYLNLKMERLVLIAIEDSFYKFSYQLNGGFVYCEKNLIIKKKFNKLQKKFFFEVTDVNSKQKTKYDKLTDEFKQQTITLLYQKCQKNIINVDLKNLPLLIKLNTFPTTFTYKNLPTKSSIGSFMDMKLKEENVYRHKPELGWCIKKNYTLLFLLNDGKFFEIELSKMTIYFKNSKYLITNELPLIIKNILKKIRSLLLMFL